MACQKNKNLFEIPKDDTKPVYYSPEDFIMGADLSYVNIIEDNGGTYKVNGQLKDPFEIIKNSGGNLVRVRLWHDPSVWQRNLNGGSISGNLADVEKTISRAKINNMYVLLDVHYSDFWADPSKQTTPKDWERLDFEILKDSVYQYTSTILKHLKAKDLTPEYIQIGNECNQGMLFPAGKITNNNFDNFAALLKSGISAVRDFSINSDTKPKIVLHVAQFQNTEWWVNGLVNQSHLTDFDVIGISHYFNFTTLPTMKSVELEIARLKNKYQKEIMVVETAYPWTKENADTYSNITSGEAGFLQYPVSKSGQFKYMKDLTSAIISGGGRGIIYWEPAWVTSSMKDAWGTGSSWENNTLFDFEGNLLSGITYMSSTY